MKNIAYLFVLSFCLFQWESYSQNVIPFDSLDGNNVNVRIYADGLFSHDIMNRSPSFIVPKDSGSTSIYATDLWIVGRDAVSNDTFLFENTFRRNSSISGFIFNGIGPIATSYPSSYESKYKRLWKVDKDQIEFHKQNVGKSNYVMIDAIKNWPAHGDVNNGEALHLAPFIDWNHDGMYTPEFGDYPCIKGDQGIYTISNNMNADSGYRWEPFPIEVHQMTYTFNTSNPLNNTVFIEYKIVNRGTSSIEDLYVGSWIDFDIGCVNDDHMGCDSTLNLFYAYNGDSIDEDCSGAHGYGSNLPFCGQVFLNQKMNSFIMPGRGTNPIRGDATSPRDFRNYLRGRWLDGEKIRIGGNGHPNDTGATTERTTYMFPADPRDSLGWNETNVGNLPFDKRGVGASGPFNIQSGESMELALALVFTQDASKQGWDVFDTFKNDVSFVQDYYDNNIHYCQNWTTGEEDLSDESIIRIFPNPVKDQLNIELNSEEGSQVSIYNVLGEEVLNYRLNNSKLHSIDVSSLKSGVYLVRVSNQDKVKVERVVLE